MTGTTAAAPGAAAYTSLDDTAKGRGLAARVLRALPASSCTDPWRIFLPRASAPWSHQFNFPECLEHSNKSGCALASHKPQLWTLSGGAWKGSPTEDIVTDQNKKVLASEQFLQMCHVIGITWLGGKVNIYSQGLASLQIDLGPRDPDSVDLVQSLGIHIFNKWHS